MEHNMEGPDLRTLRACIDKSYDTGFNNAINKVCEWLNGYAFIPTYIIKDIKNNIKP